MALGSSSTGGRGGACAAQGAAAACGAAVVAGQQPGLAAVAVGLRTGEEGYGEARKVGGATRTSHCRHSTRCRPHAPSQAALEPSAIPPRPHLLLRAGAAGGRGIGAAVVGAGLGRGISGGRGLGGRGGGRGGNGGCVCLQHLALRHDLNAAAVKALHGPHSACGTRAGRGGGQRARLQAESRGWEASAGVQGRGWRSWMHGPSPPCPLPARSPCSLPVSSKRTTRGCCRKPPGGSMAVPG